MKNFKFFLPFAALGLLASCSNDNVVDPTPDPTPEATGDMYMTINVSLPTGAGTKVSQNGYEEGLESEYAVKDMTLYVFKMSSSGSTAEADAQYMATIPVGFSNPIDKTSNPADVTGKYEATFQISQTDWDLKANGEPNTAGTKYYGLLVVNKPKTSYTEPSGTISYNDWNKNVLVATQENDAIDIVKPDGYFTMTNAPVVTKDGGNAIQILVPIETKNFTTSPNQPSVPAATFYVQRIVAKVMVGVGSVTLDGDKTVSSSSFGQIAVVHNSSDRVAVSAWGLDGTNNVTYAVQNVDDFTTWMGFDSPTTSYFTSLLANTNDPALYHFWWGKDPNYANAAGSEVNQYANSFNRIEASAVTLPTSGDENMAYCLENTMDAPLMIENQSTRVIFKATYLPGGTAWDANNNAGIIVFNDVAMVVKKTDLADPDYNIAGEVALNVLISETAETTIAGDPESTTMKSLEYYRNSLKMGNYTQNVIYYPNGETYYVAYIRHFDDTETPLTSSQKTDLTSVTYNPNQVGRYGVLRNNVYEVRLAAVNGFGSPTIPTPGNTPNDQEKPKNFNALVNINILNWAKRGYDYIPH